MFALKSLPALAALSVLLALALLAGAGTARSQEPPVYRFSVHLDSEAHSLTGLMKVELPPADPRLGSVLWFHLPPNRFLEQDSRGRRRSTDSLPFATNFAEEETLDPLWPDGFDAGGIDILAVQTAEGLALPSSLEDHPQLPEGYAVRNGLLRVDLSGAPGSRALVIRFRTRLPHRYWEGWAGHGVLLEEWHPSLLNWKDGQWDRDVFSPRAGRYQLAVTVERPGRMIAGRAWEMDVDAGRPFAMPLSAWPMRSLPLVFVSLPQMSVQHGYEVSLYSFYTAEHRRIGRLAVEIAARFLDFVRERYRLAPPDTRIAIVETDLPPGDMRTVGSLILIPRSYYQNGPFLDRVFLAQLSRAVAQVWFGEVVWSNRDRQSWLHLGLSGYLALDFFHSLYGWNAGIHNVMDWLQPKLREHFFEAPVRDLMRRKQDAPLAISLTGHPRIRPTLVVAHNKAPLVMRSLYHLVGLDAFSQGLNALYYRHRFREVSEATLAAELTAITGRDLEPFFREWFHETPRIDFAVEDWEEEAMSTGVRVRVRVRRSGATLLPVDVRVTAENGERHDQRWEGGEGAAELIFVLGAPLASITIDPEEYWLELDRKNNHSEVLYRVRPIFDWPKQREVLVALRGTAGGNAIDGNYLGLGVNLGLNENNNLQVIPIYGERTRLHNYHAAWQWRQFLLPDLSLKVTLEKLGGTTLRGLGFQYDLLETDEALVRPGIEFRNETVLSAGFVERDGTPVVQPEGIANNIAYRLEAGLKPGVFYGNRVLLESVHSQPSYDSDYEFTSHRIDFLQSFTPGDSHRLDLTLVRGSVAGTPPLQMRHPLGGPELLRGYPRVIELSNEEIAAARLEYGYIFSRAIHGSNVQLRRITGFFFGDVGRGWNNDETSQDRPQRQDLGIGLELIVNMLRLVEFPLRFDIAYPVNDPDYRDPQYIFFGVFNF